MVELVVGKWMTMGGYHNSLKIQKGSIDMLMKFTFSFGEVSIAEYSNEEKNKFGLSAQDSIHGSMICRL